MTIICVAGGTGQVGLEVVRLAVAAGHQVRVVSLPPGIPSGWGQPSFRRRRHILRRRCHHGGWPWGQALAGVEVVVDCLEGQFGKARKNNSPTAAHGSWRLLTVPAQSGPWRCRSSTAISARLLLLRLQSGEGTQLRSDSELDTVVAPGHAVPQPGRGGFRCRCQDLRLIPVFRGARFQTISTIACGPGSCWTRRWRAPFNHASQPRSPPAVLKCLG